MKKKIIISCRDPGTVDPAFNAFELIQKTQDFEPFLLVEDPATHFIDFAKKNILKVNNNCINLDGN